MGKGFLRAAALAAVIFSLFGSGVAQGESDAVGSRVAKRAKRLVGISSMAAVTTKVPDDCSGVVRLPYEREGVDLLQGAYPPDWNAVTIMYTRARRLGALTGRTPAPGDLAFFRETYDRNRDGKRNDGLTHVAIVEKVDEDGTVTLIHHGKTGVARTYMNLNAPLVKRDLQKKRLNSILVPEKKKSRNYLTSELFVIYARSEALSKSLPVRVARR